MWRNKKKPLMNLSSIVQTVLRMIMWLEKEVLVRFGKFIARGPMVFMR